MENKKITTVEDNFLYAVAKQKKSLEAFKEGARFRITSQKSLTNSKEVLGSLKEFKEGIKELDEGFYKPLSRFVRDKIYAPIKGLKDEIKEIEDFHKSEQLKWLQKIEREEQKKREEMEKKLQEKEITLEEAGKRLERVEKKAEQVQNVIIRKVVKVVDFSQVPDKYKVINQSLLNNDVLKEGLKVAGTQIVEEKSIRNR